MDWLKRITGCVFTGTRRLPSVGMVLSTNPVTGSGSVQTAGVEVDVAVAVAVAVVVEVEVGVTV
jgi:hypothetical protein